jgi:Protein of unknown function (DUF4235)
MMALYRPLGLLFSVLGGLAAGSVFKQLWKRLADEDEAPQATQADRSWREIIPAAALQGAVFGGVKAAVDRGGLKGFEKLTGVWAGD